MVLAVAFFLPVFAFAQAPIDPIADMVSVYSAAASPARHSVVRAQSAGFRQPPREATVEAFSTNTVAASPLHLPTGVAIDGNDNLYVADTYNHRVRKLTPQGELTTVAGGDGNGQGPNQLFFPRSVAVDREGNLYIADSYNHRVQRVSPSGAVTTVAGQGGGGAGADQLQYPRGLALDGTGNLYIADTYNHRVQKLAPSGVVSTVAGGRGLGNGSNQLNFPHGVAVDAAGNVYVADMLNQRVQRVDAKGNVETVLGGPSPGAGPRELRNPGGVAVDGNGALYVIDTNNDRVQMLLPSGAVLTVAGTGGQGAGDSQLFSPYTVALDSSGNMYVADTNNDRVQKIRDVQLPAVPELRSAATNRRATGAPNLQMKLSHPIVCGSNVEVLVGGYRSDARTVGGFVQFAIPEKVDWNVQTEVYVLCGGESAMPVFGLPMAAATPGVFADSDGIVLGAPAQPGDVTTIFVTGLGVLAEPHSNGLRWTANAVTVTVGGAEAEVLYSGAAPGQPAGIQQINLRIPAEAQAGSQPLVVTAGDAVSQPGVKLRVQ